VLERGRGEAGLAVLIVVAGGGGVCAAAVVVVVGFERGAGRGGGAVGGGAGVLWRGGLVGCEVHFLFFFFFRGGGKGWLCLVWDAMGWAGQGRLG
jgi:hypothetical protein